MKRILSLAGIALLLGGCADAPKRPEIPVPPPAKVAKEITDAAMSPLNDLNLMPPDVPVILRTARKAPYHRPAGCEAINSELLELDDALGPDIDAPPEKRRKADLLERGVVAAEDAAVGTAVDLVRSTTDVIPFRPWVRKLSGAERASKEVASAVFAGTHRRSFLKGMAAGTGCPPPVRPPAETEPQEVKSDKPPVWPEWI